MAHHESRSGARRVGNTVVFLGSLAVWTGGVLFAIGVGHSTSEEQQVSNTVKSCLQAVSAAVEPATFAPPEVVQSKSSCQAARELGDIDRASNEGTNLTDLAHFSNGLEPDTTTRYAEIFGSCVLATGALVVFERTCERLAG